MTFEMMKRERSFRRQARRLNVQELREKLLQEVGRLNTAINNVGVVYDQGMSEERKAFQVKEAQGQCAYVSNLLEYLFERLQNVEKEKAKQ